MTATEKQAYKLLKSSGNGLTDSNKKYKKGTWYYHRFWTCTMVVSFDFGHVQSH